MQPASSYWSEEDWNNLMKHDPERLVDQLWQQEIDEMEWRGWDPVFPRDEEMMLQDYLEYQYFSDADMEPYDSDPYDEDRPWEALGLSEKEWEAMFP